MLIGKEVGWHILNKIYKTAIIADTDRQYFSIL